MDRKYGYRNCGRIFRRDFRSVGQYFVGAVSDNGA